ncbi:uncharacterized protein LOC124341427 [Daphnia pulicaria]|uniref:uncharacterized protein LOC124341427 n=1 Tax=Daphnia pulicaria TaxID=35523 RepID=UPI001EEC5DEE|nr:uncharacterized protein LOC124341427 [Daphnia pulicaria]
MMERWLQFILILIITRDYSCAFLKEFPTVSEFYCPAEDGFYSLNNQCTTDYCFCQSAVEIRCQPCPEPLLFDTESQTCVESAYCFECPAEEGKYPVPLNCVGDYYECVDGYPQKLIF